MRCSIRGFLSRTRCVTRSGKNFFGHSLSLKRSNDNPHQTDNILALTPESAASIMVVGRARDLGMCTVTKKDGKICGSWCDKRVSDVCEWHLQNAVQRRRAGRAEFSIGCVVPCALIVLLFKFSLQPILVLNIFSPLGQWGCQHLQLRNEDRPTILHANGGLSPSLTREALLTSFQVT